MPRRPRMHVRVSRKPCPGLLVRLPVRPAQFTYIGPAASAVKDVDAGRKREHDSAVAIVADAVLGCVGKGGDVEGPCPECLEAVGAGGGVEGVCHGVVWGVDGALAWR